MRRVCGLCPLMVSHHASVSLRNSRCGTHLLMRPMATASCAVKRRAQKIISRASRSPMMRGRYCVAPTVGHAPTRAPVWPRTALSDAMTRSHHKATWSLRSEEHTSELQSRLHLVCRLLLEKKKNYCTKDGRVINRLPATYPLTTTSALS